MQAQIYDANGNQVTENTAICTRCGAHIKHVFYHEGEPYGSECIFKVTGIDAEHQVYRNGEIDIEASHAKKAELERQQQERIKRNRASEARAKAVREANCERYAELINVLQNTSRYNGDFCSQMASYITNATFSTELYEGIFSHNQFNTVRDIWGKHTGGRKNSKAFKVAVAEFDRKFDNA